MATYDKPADSLIAVCAARMLLEEAARVAWRYSVAKSEFESRAKQYFDEFRAMRKKTIDTLSGSGISRSTAERLLTAPDNVRQVTPLDQIAKGRVPLPSISSMLRELSARDAEPGWLEVAYTLLSQMTHSTPVAYLHTIRAGSPWGNGMSPEMLALAIDTACLSSAQLIGLGAMLLTDLSKEAQDYRQRLLEAAAEVHDAARTVHWLD